jgi:hypothetical protein
MCDLAVNKNEDADAEEDVKDKTLVINLNGPF